MRWLSIIYHKKKSIPSGNEKTDIRTKVYKTFLTNIANGKWKSGDKIPSENQLADSMGVSRITVREAMQKLVALDLVETQHGSGSYVKELSSNNSLFMIEPEIFEPSTQDIQYLIELRRILEVGMMSLVVERAKPGDTDVLLNYTHEMSDNLNNFEAYAFYDVQFHTKLIHMSYNPVIINSAANTLRILEKSILRTLSAEGASSGILFNTQIIRAINMKDKSAAAKAMSNLLDDVEKSLSNSFEGHGDEDRIK